MREKNFLKSFLTLLLSSSLSREHKQIILSPISTLRNTRPSTMKILNFLILLSILCTANCDEGDDIIVDCEFGLPFPHLIKEYCCTVQNLTLITSRENREFKKVIGEHKNGKNNDDVEHYRGYAARSDFFPLRVTKFFKNVKTMQMTYSKIKEISKNDLQQFGGKLKKIFLDFGELEVIESDLFEFNPNLEEIFLDHNQIKIVKLGAFDGLEKLHTLDIGDNPCFEGEVSEVRDNRENVLELIKQIYAECDGSPKLTLQEKVLQRMWELRKSLYPEG